MWLISLIIKFQTTFLFPFYFLPCHFLLLTSKKVYSLICIQAAESSFSDNFKTDNLFLYCRHSCVSISTFIAPTSITAGICLLFFTSLKCAKEWQYIKPGDYNLAVNVGAYTVHIFQHFFGSKKCFTVEMSKKASQTRPKCWQNEKLMWDTLFNTERNISVQHLQSTDMKIEER